MERRHFEMDYEEEQLQGSLDDSLELQGDGSDEEEQWQGLLDDAGRTRRRRRIKEGIVAAARAFIFSRDGYARRRATGGACH